jgi:addiction module HigA family antidote
MIPRHRAPTHPGEILQQDFLLPLKVSQLALAEKLSIPVQRINTLVNGKRGVTAETAILLGEALGTSPEFWMNLQTSWDLFHAHQRLKAA